MQDWRIQQLPIIFHRNSKIPDKVKAGKKGAEEKKRKRNSRTKINVGCCERVPKFYLIRKTKTVTTGHER